MECSVWNVMEWSWKEWKGVELNVMECNGVEWNGIKWNVMMERNFMECNGRLVVGWDWVNSDSSLSCWGRFYRTVTCLRFQKRKPFLFIKNTPKKIEIIYEQRCLKSSRPVLICTFVSFFFWNFCPFRTSKSLLFRPRSPSYHVHKGFRNNLRFKAPLF